MDEHRCTCGWLADSSDPTATQIWDRCGPQVMLQRSTVPSAATAGLEIRSDSLSSSVCDPSVLG